MTDRDIMQRMAKRIEELEAQLRIGTSNSDVNPYARPEQEPVAWGVFDGPNLHDMFFTKEDAQEMVRLKGDGSTVKPLYTTPPQRTWVGLTDEEVKYFVSKLWPVGAGAGKLFRAIEAKLKEKNT